MQFYAKLDDNDKVKAIGTNTEGMKEDKLIPLAQIPSRQEIINLMFSKYNRETGEFEKESADK